MQKHDLITAWLKERFDCKDENYFDEWRARFAGLDCETQIPHQMDLSSRRAWGRVTGRRYAIIKYNYDVDPVFEVVDLKTGLTTKETEYIKDNLESFKTEEE